MSEDYDNENENLSKILHVMRKAPHGTIYTYEGLEMILIMAAYDQDITVVFIDDGVYSLKKDQDTAGLGIKGFSKTFTALDDYDVEKLYVDRQSLEDRGLTQDDLVVPVEVLEADKIAEIMADQDTVVHH